MLFKRSELGSNGNERMPHIPQSSRAGTSPSNCLVSYPGHLLEGGSYASAEIQSVYSTAPANWATLLESFFTAVPACNRLFTWPVKKTTPSISIVNDVGIKVESQRWFFLFSLQNAIAGRTFSRSLPLYQCQTQCYTLFDTIYIIESFHIIPDTQSDNY